MHYSSKWGKLAGVDFPLEKMSGPVEGDGRVQGAREAEEKWRGVYPGERYDVWEGVVFGNEESDGMRVGEKVFTLPTTCAWCQRITRLTFDLGENVGIRHKERCCEDARLTDGWGVSRRVFANDAKAFLAARGAEAALCLKSAALKPVTGEDESKVMVQWLRDVTYDGETSLFAHIANKGAEMSMEETEEVITSALGNIDYSPEGELLCDVLQRIANSYAADGVSGRFCCRLDTTVKATERVAWYLVSNFVPPTHKGYAFTMSKVDNFIMRYKRWLHLLGKDKGSGELMPTPDMMLVWCTHLLTPLGYHSWCREELGRCIDGYAYPDAQGRREAEKALNEAWEKEHNLPIRREMLKHVYTEATTNPPVVTLREKFGESAGAREGGGLIEFSSGGGFGGVGGGD